MYDTIQSLQDILDVKFSWYDYSFFLLILILSAMTGVYYGLYNKQQTAEDYLLGGKSLGILPVTLSLIASNTSGLGLLAMPSDVYINGISYWFTYVSAVFVIFTSYKVFLPVFARLHITSTFEYLKLRFDTKTRLLGSILYFISAILYLPLIIYVTALALAQATRLNLYLISTLVCVVCIFYTSLGGLRAVVYSDALRSIIVVGSLMVAFIIGVIRCDGVQNIWNTSYENDRLALSIDIDFTKRNGLWAVTLGQFIAWSSYLGINQVYIQKCLSLPTSKDVLIVLVIFTIGLFTIGSVCNFIGLVMFTEYSGCDPLKAGILQKQDQLLPYYILDISKQIPGLAGLFIAGIFSATLSMLAGVLNGLSCTIYEDFISPYISPDTSERKTSLILKGIVVITGVTCSAMVVVVERLGGMLALSNSLAGITSGPVLGLFVAGMLIPAINAKGAYYGSIISTTLMSIMVLGSQWYQNSGYITTPSLPVSIATCTFLNSSGDNHQETTPMPIIVSDEVPYIFKIPFYWYCSIGLILSITFGLVISMITKNKDVVDRNLLSPVVFRFCLWKRTRQSVYPIN